MMLLLNCPTNNCPHNTISILHLWTNEPEQAVCAFTVPSRSGQNNTIGTDSNEPMRSIHIFTVPPTIGPHNTISSLLPWIKWAHTIILSYDDASNPEPNRAICVHTVSLRSDHYNVISPGSDDSIWCICILTIPPTIRPHDAICIYCLWIKWARASHSCVHCPMNKWLKWYHLSRRPAHSTYLRLTHKLWASCGHALGLSD